MIRPWTIAFWLEQQRGAAGDLYIKQLIGRPQTKSDRAGMAIWRMARERFDALDEVETGRS